MKKANYYTPAVTAFKEDGTLDMEGNRAIWEHLIRGGVSGLVVMGSIGEFFSLTAAEMREMIDEVTAYTRGRIPVLVGTGGMNAEETIMLSNYALSRKAEGVIIISPYYFPLSQPAVQDYYDTVCRRIEGPVYLYSFPDRTGYDISPQVTLNLLRRHKNILGYKDTVAEMGHTRALIQAVSGEFPEFEIFSGFDEFMFHNMLCGGSGCIGGLSNIYPELAAAWVYAADEMNLEMIEKIQRVIDRLMEIYAVADIFVPVIKEGIRMRGVPVRSACRNALGSLDQRQKEHLMVVMKAAEELMEEYRII